MSDVNIRPLFDRIVIKPISKEETASGLIIPSTAKEELTPEKGSVIYTGSKCKNKLLKTGVTVYSKSILLILLA